MTGQGWLANVLSGRAALLLVRKAVLLLLVACRVGADRAVTGIVRDAMTTQSRNESLKLSFTKVRSSVHEAVSKSMRVNQVQQNLPNPETQLARLGVWSQSMRMADHCSPNKPLGHRRTLLHCTRVIQTARPLSRLWADFQALANVL